MLRARFGLAAVVAPMMVVLVGGSAFGASPPGAVWHMSETSGSIMRDSSGYANTGTLKHIQLGLAGQSGLAYGFDGKSSVITVPDSASLNAGTGDLVATVHVKFSAVPDEDYDLIRKGLSSTAGGDWKIEVINVDDQAIARCYLKGSAGSWQKTTGPNLADGAWHTITCEKHAKTVAMSIDGRVWKKTKSVGTLSNKAVLSIGAKAEGGDWYNGVMDEVSVVTGP